MVQCNQSYPMGSLDQIQQIGFLLTEYPRFLMKPSTVLQNQEREDTWMFSLSVQRAHLYHQILCFGTFGFERTNDTKMLFLLSENISFHFFICEDQVEHTLAARTYPTPPLLLWTPLELRRSTTRSRTERVTTQLNKDCAINSTPYIFFKTYTALFAALLRSETNPLTALWGRGGLITIIPPHFN